MRYYEKDRLIDKIFPDKMRALIIVIILVAAFLFTKLAIHFQYGSYDLNVSDSSENTLVYSYYSVGDHILKVASDTAILCTEDNNTVWKQNYDMTNPAVDTCGETFIIYDKNGTTVGVYNTSGKINEFNTELPIITASAARQGTVAAILDDGLETRIDYCDSAGEIISTIKTGMSGDGYPMSLSLSVDGKLLAVAYLTYVNQNETALVKFYNFTATGQRETDNVTNSYYYENCIIPEIRYLDETRCVAFGSDRIVVYDRADIPIEKKTIGISGIKSTFHSDTYFGVLTNTDEEKMTSDLKIYDKSGNELLDKPINFTYLDVNMKDSEVFLSGRNEICLISVLGDIKYRGSPSNMMRKVLPIRNNKLAYITAESFNIITMT